MKKLLTFFLMLALSLTVFAQAPQQFTYQAVVRNNSNHLMANAPVTVTVSLLQGSESGSVVYAETHNATTNVNGLMTLLIGGGTVTSGVFADIEWGSGPYFIKVETDMGNDGRITTVQQLLSVPYAQYANKVGNYTETDPTVPAWAKESEKPNYDYTEIKNTPEIPMVPTKVSAFENDANYLKTETDPTVPAWAKESSKPNYDYTEIKNTPTIPTVPTKVSAFENDANYLKTETDPTVPAWAKESSKPNYDYTEIKNTPTIPTVPTKVSAFENDANYLKTETDPTVPAWAKESSKPNYDYTEIKNTPTIPTVPTVVSVFDNDAQYITKQEFDSRMQEERNAQQAKSDSLSQVLDEMTFTCGKKIRDIDGNTYRTIQFGEQCWMQDNLRTTHYADGTDVPAGLTYSYTEPFRYAPDDDSTLIATYGYLYNWNAVMHGEASSAANPSGVQGVCPNGWHVPSDAEWTQLINYISGQKEYVCGGDNISIAKAMASTMGWNTNASGNECSPGNQSVYENNATGFSAYPAGFYTGFGHANRGAVANFWTTTSPYANYANYYYIYKDNPDVIRDGYYALNGYSVRCVYNNNSVNAQLDAQQSEVESLQSTLNSLAPVAFSGDYDDLANTPEMPTVPTMVSAFENDAQYITKRQFDSLMNSIRVAQQQADSLQEIIDGMKDQMQFKCGTSTIEDYDFNKYHTVAIGSQCWMRENLRTEHYADGTPIEHGTSTSTTEGYWYYPNNDAANKTTYGLLYNWAAVMNGEESSEANPSGVQGPCPTGWHVPSDAEWLQLIDYVKTQYSCDSPNNYAKALAATTGWDSSSETCAVGNNQSSNNVLGFSAVPTGLYNGLYSNIGRYAYFWSTTKYNSTNAYYRYLCYNFTNMNRSYGAFQGLSVRCLHD